MARHRLFYQQDFSVVGGIDDVAVKEELELDIARVPLQTLHDLTADGTQRVVGVGVDLKIVNLGVDVMKLFPSSLTLRQTS